MKNKKTLNVENKEMLHQLTLQHAYDIHEGMELDLFKILRQQIHEWAAVGEKFEVPVLQFYFYNHNFNYNYKFKPIF